MIRLPVLASALIVTLITQGCHTTSASKSHGNTTVEEIKKNVGKASKHLERASSNLHKHTPASSTPSPVPAFKWFGVVIGGTVVIVLAATFSCTNMRPKRKGKE